MMSFAGLKKATVQPTRYGLHTLVDKDTGAQEIVDIVAIHSLNGDYERTWTSRNDTMTPVNWLRDLLPKDVKNARIMSFAYNSSVQFSKSTTGIYDVADQLLEELLIQRSGDAQCLRPLIFICHSLGGIVFKQMMNKAHENTKYTTTILKCVHGVLFFGTPHGGSGVAKWGMILSNILQTASLGTRTNSKLIKDLQRNSDVLTIVSGSFTQSGKNLNIVSFYEMQKMDYLNCLVVDKQSATLGWPQEARIPLEANHRSMCWFTNTDEPGYLLVKGCISRMASEAKILAHNSTHISPKSILMELGSSNYEAHKDRNPEAIQGTCLWIFQHQSYETWINEPGPSLLWMSADPGCGKSVLSSFLVDNYKQELSGRGNICYFFFKADNEEQTSAVHALSAILHQLYTSQPELIEPAQKILQVPGVNARELPTLWKMFTESVDDSNAQRTICILDGLDECELQTRKQLVHMISKYFVELNQSVERGKRLKLFVTSRPDNAIKSAFDRPLCSNRMKMIRLRGEDEVDSISADVELVIKQTMKSFVDQGLPIDLLEEMQHQLIARADRTFLWTTLILELMREKVEEGASQRDLEIILQNRSVYGIYSELLNSKANHVKARKLLDLVLAALEPLTVDELSIALAIQPEHNSLENTSTPRRPGTKTFSQTERDISYPTENYIKGLCGHFIRIIRKRVYLVHQTAREFLLDEASWDLVDDLHLHEEEQDEPFWSIEMSDMNVANEKQDHINLATEGTEPIDSVVIKSPWQYSFSLLRAHGLILEICVTYLYLLGKTSATSRLGKPSQKMSAFLRYASKFWLTHFHIICDQIPVQHVSYYQGLCHPQFPGFQALTEFKELPLEFTMRSDDEKQDFLVDFFGLEPGDSRHNKDRSTANSTVSVNFGLSSNPAAAENFHFAVKPDPTGYVSLDFNQTLKMFGSGRM